MLLVLMVLVLMVLVLMVLVLMVLVLMSRHEDQSQPAYFMAVFTASGVYQIGDDQTRS